MHRGANATPRPKSVRDVFDEEQPHQISHRRREPDKDGRAGRIVKSTRDSVLVIGQYIEQLKTIAGEIQRAAW